MDTSACDRLHHSITVEPPSLDRAGRSCLLCGAPPPLTREHVIPAWLHTALNVEGSVRVETGRGGTIRRMPRRFNMQYRAVCADCNNGFLNDLEGEFRRLMRHALRGLRVDLDRAAQRIVATWGVKTWLIAELALEHDRGTAVGAPDILRFIRASGEPPEMLQVRLGAQENLPTLFRVATMPVGYPPDDIRGVVGSMSVGFVLFNIYGPIVREVPAQVRHLALGPELGRALPQIWPTESAIVRWPPPRVLSREEVERLWPGDGYLSPSRDVGPSG